MREDAIPGVGIAAIPGRKIWRSKWAFCLLITWGFCVDNGVFVVDEMGKTLEGLGTGASYSQFVHNLSTRFPQDRVNYFCGSNVLVVVYLWRSGVVLMRSYPQNGGFFYYSSSCSN